jgi:putative transcriptional regulator
MLEFGADPARHLAGGGLAGRCEPVPGVQVAGDQSVGPEDRLRGPPVSVEDPDPVPEEPVGGMDRHFAREMGREPDVVVSEYDVDLDPGREEVGEHAEECRAKRARSAHDRMLHVPRHDEATDPARIAGGEESIPDRSRGTLGGSRGAALAGRQAQVEVGHDEPRPGVARGVDADDREAAERGDLRLRHGPPLGRRGRNRLRRAVEELCEVLFYPPDDGTTIVERSASSEGRTGPRDRAIERIRQLLESAGFFVTDAHHVRPSSFDLLARRDSQLLIVKILKNIDALDPGEAARIAELGRQFPAKVLVIGHTSGGNELEPGVVYSRYGVPIVVEESLQEYLQKGIPPFLFSGPGGIFARVDGPRLRALREERRISLGALASIAGVSRRTIQLYEDGAGAEVEIIERLERYLSEPIARPLDLFADERPSAEAGEPGTSPEPEPPESPRRLRPTGDALRDGVVRQLNGMGWEVTVTIRCPFDALSHADARGADRTLLTSVGTLRTAQSRADLLLQLARVAEGHAMFVVREATGRTDIEGLPILSVRELQRHRDRGELIDVIEERGAG